MMAAPSTVREPQPAELIMQLATGFMASAALQTVTRLGIPDLLAGGTKSTAELARATQTNEDGLYRVMRALASSGVFHESPARAFSLTPAGECLVSGRPGSAREMVLWMTDRLHYETYPEMLHAVKTGQTVIEKVHGASCFEYFAKNPEVSEVFNAAMTSFSASVAAAVLEAYDFSWLNGRTLVDVAGGHGHLLTEILKRYPDVHGTLFDLDHVLEGAKPRIAAAGLDGRCRLESGDFFTAVPAGSGYLMKHIIHDWNDSRALTILRNIHRASEPSAKVVLLEAVLTTGNEPHFAKWLDLEMMLLPGGRERTADEFAALFKQAGFQLRNIFPTKSSLNVIEAEKIS
ncbi:MAG TPA: methyltransferase [Candidatus Acidoferrum sp.]|nr:methyltransferase [Candidatus Acidoferrum sp.]